MNSPHNFIAKQWIERQLRIKKKMKFYRQLIESIIDIPRKTYAPSVFDNADTENPKLKQKVLDMIDKQIKEFEKLAPVVSTSLIGSILTKRYRNDADLDINVLFDVPEDEQEERRDTIFWFTKRYQW